MDEYRKDNSDYVPNFVLRDSDSPAEETSHAAPDSRAAYSGTNAGAAYDSANGGTAYGMPNNNGAPDSGSHETAGSGLFTDPREKFRKNSNAGSSYGDSSYANNNSYSSGDSFGNSSPYGNGSYSGNDNPYTNSSYSADSNYTEGSSPYGNGSGIYGDGSGYGDYSSYGSGGTRSEYDSADFTQENEFPPGTSASWDNQNGLGKIRGRKKRRPRKPSPQVTFTRRSLAWIIVLCLIVSGGVGFGSAAAGNLLFDKDTAASTKTGSVTTTGYTLEDATGSNKTVQEITAEAKPSVVEIKTESVSSDSWMQQYVTEGAGSGVIIKEDGYIVTNNHVIEGASKITVTTSDQQEYEAELVGTDTTSDIAVLKIDASGLTPATYGNSDQLQVGDMAVAIGNPLGELGGTVTAGIISALDRELSIDGKTMTLLQTDSSINPGNSGGGLFNGDGQLIGIVVAKSSGSDVEGLGFAIPINKAADCAQQIIEKGYVSGQPSTGMSYVESSGQTSSSDMLFNNGQSTTYVYIASVEGTNAKKAGFQKGDMVYAVDGTEITSFNTLSSIVTAHSVGDKLKFTIVRNNQKMDITLTLEEKTS